MNSQPLISIITVCLNSEKTIRATLESIISQTYENYEYIIKDGGSKDNTINIIEEYIPKFKGKLKLLEKPDTGIYNAMNQGIAVCSGDIIGIINSDDYYAPYTLADVAEIYRAQNDPMIVIIGDMEKVSSNGELIYRYMYNEAMVEKKGCFGHPSMFATREVYKKIGYYDESYMLAADGDWQYRAMYDHEITVLLSHKVYNHMREGGASDNPKYRWKWFKERYRLETTYHRGTSIQIIFREIKSLLRTDLKIILPRKVQEHLYKVRYMKNK